MQRLTLEMKQVLKASMFHVLGRAACTFAPRQKGTIPEQASHADIDTKKFIHLVLLTSRLSFGAAILGTRGLAR